VDPVGAEEGRSGGGAFEAARLLLPCCGPHPHQGSLKAHPAPPPPLPLQVSGATSLKDLHLRTLGG